MQVIMELDCIPAGMELFPAADDDQLAFISRIIDDSDYYLLLVGGRYGSLHSSGVSFTELEYDYAVSKGIRVLAFLHETPEELRDSGETGDQFEKLLEFRAKVSANRMVKMWSDPADLPGLVALSLARAMKTYPAVGWVRADQVPKKEILQELNEVRKQKEALESEVRRLRKQLKPRMEGLATLDDSIKINGRSRALKGQWRNWEVEMTFRELFAAVAPYLLEMPTDRSAKLHLKEAIKTRAGRRDVYETRIDDQVFQTIKVQLVALGLINVDYSKTTQGGMALFWKLTAAGQQALFELRSVKKDSPTDRGASAV